MTRHVRLIGLLGAILALGALAPAPGALASGFPAQPEATPIPGAVCSLKIDTKVVAIPAIGPTVIEVIDPADCAAATGNRPVTVVSAVSTVGLGAVTTDGSHLVYNPTACTTGTDYVTYTITNGATSASGTLVVDIRKPADNPVNDAPTANFVKGGTMGSTMPVRVAWCGVAASGSTVTGYRVEQGTNAGVSFPTVIGYATKSASFIRNAAFNTSYAWRIRTTDSRNRQSLTYAPSLTSRVTRYQDNGGRIRYSSGWKTASSSKYSGSREHYVARSGAIATLTVSNVRQFAIVASRGSGRGSFHVYVDGRRITTSAISERASSAFKKVLFVGNIPGNTAATHTIQVRTTSKARVGLDAIVTLSGRQTPGITFSTAAPGSAAYGGSDAVTASAPGGLPVTVTVAQGSWGACSVAGATVSFHGTGPCVLNATVAADPSWNAASASLAFTVAPALLTVSGISAADRAYDGTTTATLDTTGARLASGVVGNDDVALDTTRSSATFADPNAGPGKPVSVTGLSLTGTRAQLYTLAPLTLLATIVKADQAITFLPSTPPAGMIKGGPAYALSATAASGLPVTLSINPASAAVCAISGTTVSFPGSGSCQIEANQDGNGNWNPAPTAVLPFSVASTGSTSQAITFQAIGPATYGDGPVTLNASATPSGLPVTLISTTPNVCAISGATAVILAAGQCQIDADQAGDPTYAAATQVERAFTVSKKMLTVTGVTASGKTYDGSPVATINTGAAALVGLIGSDAVTLVKTGATGSFANATAGSGKTVTLAGMALAGSKAGSYALTQPTTTATIAKATLTLTADNHSIVYGATDPAFTFVYGPFVNGETSSAITTAPTCSIAGSARDVSGSPYPINCAGGVATNYAFSFAGGTLTVTPRPLSVTFTIQAKIFDGTTTATITGCSLATIVSGDAATCSHASAVATFDAAAAGGPRTVIGSGFTVVGADSGNYLINQVDTVSAPIARANASCTVTGYSVTYDAASHTATGSCTGIGGTTLAGLDLSATTRTNAGTYNGLGWTFTDATGNYNNTSDTVDAVIAQAPQAINFTSTAPSPGIAAGPTYTVAATGGISGNPVTFSSANTSVCETSGTNGSTVMFLIAGTCTIHANQAGTTNYSAAIQATQTVTVVKDTQTITFGGLGTKTFGDAPFTVGASASSSLAVTFSSQTTGVCTVSGTTVTLVTAGSCTVRASQAGDATWQPAPDVDRAFTVNPANQTITITSTTPVGAQVGGFYTPTATATSNLAVTFTIDATTTSVCSISAGVVHFNAVGTCTVDATQGGNTSWNPAPQQQQAFAVSLQSQTITFGTLADHPYGASFAVPATSDSGLTVALDTSTTPSVCTVSGSSVTVISTGTCTVRATQPGNSTFAAAAPVSHSFTATPRPITVTAVSDSRAANGTTSSAGTPTVTAGSLVAGDTGTFVQLFDTSAAGTGKTLTPSGTIASGPTDVSANYAITWQAVSTGTITAAAADHLVLTPATTPLTAGGTVSFTAAAFDAFGNSRGDVTAGTTFTISPDGSCTSADCSATVVGAHVVTGTYLGTVTGTASVTVHAAAASVNTTTITAVPATLVGDGVTTSGVTVRLLDTYGNPLTSSGATVTLKLTGPGSLGAVANNGDGTYSATYTSAVVGAADSATITGTIDAVPIVDDAVITLDP